MKRRFRPRRRLRDEVFALSLVAFGLWTVAAAFPRDVLRSTVAPSATAGVRPSCAFVELTPEAERRVISAARTAWQMGRRPGFGARADLFCAEIPAVPVRPALGLGARARSAGDSGRYYDPDPVASSLAAPAPAVLPEQPARKRRDVFSREEFLRLD